MQDVRFAIALRRACEAEGAGAQASWPSIRPRLTLAGPRRLLYDRHAALQPSRLLLDDPGVFMANDRTLVQIRERSYLDLLDLALLVVRQRPRTLGLAAAAGIAPFAALNYWILSNPDTPPAISGVPGTPSGVPGTPYTTPAGR